MNTAGFGRPVPFGIQHKGRPRRVKTISSPDESRTCSAEVQEFRKDFARDFSIALSFEDAERMLILHQELCELLDRYSEDTIHPHCLFEEDGC
jgi:hypothetical protein